jgi:hypothetical protein
MHIIAIQPNVIETLINPSITHVLNPPAIIQSTNMFRSMPILPSAPSVASLPRQQSIGCNATTPLRRPVFLLASATSSGNTGDSSNITPQQQNASQNLVNLVKNKELLPTEAQLQDAVDTLLSTGTGTKNPGSSTMTSGNGTWNTVHAPHINRMSSILGTKFNISYTLTGPPNSNSATTAPTSPPQFYSNVRYESPLFGTGWLSASGRLFSNDSDSVELHFDTFWVDEGGEKSDLRPFLTEKTMNSGDKFISAVGRVTFFEGLAKFPVLYLDNDTGVSVFRFPPLRSNITVVRQ